MRFIVSKNKEFYFFVFTVLLPQSVGYVVLSCVFALSFYKKRICGWLGSSCRRRYYNIQKILVYYSIVCRVCFWVFFIGRLCGLFVVIVLVIDFRLIDAIVCRVCFDGLFERVFD